VTSPDRRNVLAGLVAVGAAAPLLAACGNGGGPGATSTAGDPATPGGAASGGGNGAGGAGGGGGGIKTSEIPVGGGKVFAGQGVVVTQPKAGEFKAFSAVCTHQGCTVSRVADGTIDCPCHFSRFSIADGSVEDGPAPKPLPQKTVTVTGNTLTVS
jgi:Rieske Fe-S protein